MPTNVDQRVNGMGNKIARIYNRAPMPIDMPQDFDESKHDFAQGCSICSTNFKIPAPYNKTEGPHNE